MMTKHGKAKAAYKASDRRGMFSNLLRNLLRFRKSDEGATALEFAFVGPVVLMLIISITDIGIYFFIDRTVEASTDLLARRVKTGINRGLVEEATLKQEFCALPTMQLFECSNVHLDIQEIGRFKKPEGMKRNPDGSIDSSGFGVNLGGSSTIHIVRVFVNWPTFQTWINAGEWVDGDRMVASSTAFLSE